MSPRARRWGLLGVVLVLGVTGWLFAGHQREEAEREKLIGELRARIAARAPVEAGGDGEGIPDAENAAVLYADAAQRLAAAAAADEHWVDALEVANGEAVPDHVRAFVETNSAACALVDRAAILPRCGWKGRDSLPLDGVSQVFLLERVRGLLALERGDLQGAVAAAHRVLVLGRRLPPVDLDGFQGLLLLRWNGEQRALSLLEYVVADPRLDTASAAAVRTVLEEMGDPWEFWTSKFRLDYRQAEERSVRLLGPSWWDEIEALGYATSWVYRVKQALPGARSKGNPPQGQPTAAEVRWILSVAQRCLDALEARAGPALAPDGELAALHERRPGEEWALGFLVGDGKSMGRLCCEAEVRREAVRGALAARAFTLREGRPPRGWEEMVPSLLPAVPRDPFTGGTLGLEVTADGHGSVGCAGWVKEVRFRW